MRNRSSVRRTLGLAAAITLLAVVTSNGPARAQDLNDIKGEGVTFDTKDGVKLQGTFYVGKNNDQPTVLMLHKLKSDSSQGSWVEFAKRLNLAGYSVLTFDFRGHGDSKKVDQDHFWNKLESPHNFKWLKPLDKAGKLRDKIDHADFQPGYYPYLVNDIAAAKLFLDERNDALKCNSRALIVLGAEDGATLGAIWMASEWDRYAVGQLLDGFGRFSPRGIATEPEGKAQYCAIWLNIKTELAGKLPVRLTLGKCVERVGGTKNALTGAKNFEVPMLFVCGAESKDDMESAPVKMSADLVKLLKGPKPDDSNLKYTALKRIVAKVDGADLLDKSLGTADAILKDYLPKLAEDVKPNKWRQSDFDKTPAIWLFNNGTVPVIAKTEKGKVELIPLGRYGLTP